MEYVQKLFSTRGGTLVLAGVAAVLAAVAVLVYVQHYRSSVKAGGEPATVLVASSLITKGTPGTAVAAKHQFTTASIRENQLRDGAISDPSSLTGRVAADDIYPGQQLTAFDFVNTPDTVASRLVGDQRAITLPLDSAHGLIGNVRTGDRVDVYVGFNVTPVDTAGRPTGGQGQPVLRLVVQNAPVLAIEAKKSSTLSSSASQQNRVTLRVNPTQAGALAFAADNGKVWLVLRPPGSPPTKATSIIAAPTVLLGIPPVQVLRQLGGRR